MIKFTSKSKRFFTAREDISLKLCFAVMQFYFLQSCGKSGESVEEHDFKRNLDGFIDTYQPPDWSYDEPTTKDPFINILKSNYVNPYWVDALTMDAWETHVQTNVADNNNIMYFSFPEVNPDYSTSIVSGWTPAVHEVQQASREIFEKINTVLEVQFVEEPSANGTNVIAIAQSFQEKTSGFSYFPNFFYEIGSDTFISNSYSKPEFISSNITNFDYEVLVHEIGHAIGLKHPFEADGNNPVILPEAEDTTAFTAMSYTDFENTFNGTFRDLDWLALSKLYGVNDDYKSGDDTYNFSQNASTLILDGSGIDVIDASSFEIDVNIDLRPGAHSFVGAKSEFILTKLQLTISHDTIIENVITGSGNDRIMGNSSENFITTNSGDDIIYLGAGDDIVNPGSGADSIDLSEENSCTDMIVFEQSALSENCDTVYGFEQGSSGDILDISDLISETLSLLPVILYNFVPIGFISDHILRVVGPELDTAADIKDAFSNDGLFHNLELSNDKLILIISSETVDTGENQNLFCIKETNGLVEVNHISLFVGNSLDIDIWSIDNFATSDTDILA